MTICYFFLGCAIACFFIALIGSASEIFEFLVRVLQKILSPMTEKEKMEAGKRLIVDASKKEQANDYQTN